MRILEWFERRSWHAADFQLETWRAYLAGQSGLIHASTGSGKTYAAYLGALEEALGENSTELQPLRVLWITPLRALSSDTALSLEAPLRELNFKWDVGVRTGDTSSSQRAKQKARLPSVLVTTPESLELSFTQPDAKERFANLRLVVVDEWHELFGTKRGVMAELSLARLRSLCPKLRTWGLSATLGNSDVAMRALLGTGHTGVLVRGGGNKPLLIDSILPEIIERFPWAGHLGLTLVPQVVAAIEEGRTALVFTNTRSQTELWYRAILAAKPAWAGLMALHHGSLERSTRDWVEDQLRLGSLRCVVSTSSLDLGVDFSPVDRVIQIGSPKGVARLMQRAGRSGHQPGVPSRVTCVPTNAFELIEMVAARTAAMNHTIESRQPIPQPLDVLSQHALTLAVGGGFEPEELYREVRRTFAYRHLTPDEWAWVLDYITRGGESLRAYPDFQRVTVEDGRYLMTDAKRVRKHRMSIGTIVSEASVSVQYASGARLGSVEEVFAAKMQPGDCFGFAGKTLEVVRFQAMALQVKPSKKKPNTVPRWGGGRMPLSSELAAAVRDQLHLASIGRYDSPELRAVKPILDVQQRWSAIPAHGQMLLETLRTREGHHAFFFPFEGRQVHEGLATVLAYRLGKQTPQSFSLAVNDYGFELLSADPIDLGDVRALLGIENFAADVHETLNASELAKRQFREVARIAGLVSSGMPHENRSAKQLHANSSLFYSVFKEYDPENLLLWQANREVLERQLEFHRLEAALDRIATSEIVRMEPSKPTPFAFPLLVERLRDSLSTEKLATRVQKMIRDLEAQVRKP